MMTTDASTQKLVCVLDNVKQKISYRSTRDTRSRMTWNLLLLLGADDIREPTVESCIESALQSLDYILCHTFV